MTTVSNLTTLEGSLEQRQFKLDGYVVAIQHATYYPTGNWQISLWDDAGNKVYGPIDMGTKAAFADISDLWHVRDDGNGAFTAYYLSDHLSSRTPVMQSFTADGTASDPVEISMPSRELTFGTVVIPQQLLEAYADAVDLGNGRVLAFNHDQVLGTESHLVTYEADGTILRDITWDATVTGTGAGALGGMSLSVSGNNAFVFHMNTGLSTDDDFEVYARVVALDGSFVTDEFRVSNGTHTRGTYGFASGDVDSATLTDGKVVVTWSSKREDTGADGTLDLWYKIFNSDGTVFKDEALVNKDLIGGSQSQPTIHVLANGGFVITYNSDDYDTFTNAAVIQGFDANGDLDGSASLPLDRFYMAEDSVIFPDGFGYIADAAERLHSLQIDVETSAPNTPTEGADSLTGTASADKIDGAGGNDTINGLDGADTLIGGAGDDFIFGGSTDADLRDIIYGGTGNDSIDGGYGNDELRGDAGNDSIEGGFGVDIVIGGAGNDVLTGSAWSDQIFGGDDDDFINGGFGFDRVNGGSGADKFYHTNAAGHGSDWIQDYNAAEGDVLFFGGGAATKADFLVQKASTAAAGDAAVQEVFITHVPSGNLLWALVDGDGQSSLNVLAAGQTFDLLA